MADTTTLLTVKYGATANLPTQASQWNDGSLYFTTDDRPTIWVKLPNKDAFQINANIATKALEVNGILTFGTKTYNGSENRTITLNDLGGLASTRDIKSVAMSSGGVITITRQDDTTVTSTAPSAWTIKATTAGTADKALALESTHLLNVSYYNAATSGISWYGADSKNIYIGAKNILAGTNNANSKATSDTANNATYLLSQIQTGMNSSTPTWQTTDSIQIIGTEGVEVSANNNVLTIRGTTYNIPTVLPNPYPLITSSSATGEGLLAVGGEYNGSATKYISYASIGAAPATGINVTTALDWAGAATAGWTIPPSVIPKEAMLDLVYIDTSGADQVATAATGLVEVGDLIQANDNKLYYVTALNSSGKPTLTEVHVGSAAHATTAGTTDGSLSIYKSSTLVKQFNGADAAIRFNTGLITGSTRSATSVATSTTAETNKVYLNSLFNIVDTSSGTTQAVAGSVKFMGGGDIKVSSAKDTNDGDIGAITISYTQPSTLPNPQAFNINTRANSTATVTQYISYTGNEEKNFRITRGLQEGDIVATFSNGTTDFSLYSGVTWDTF